MLGDLKEHPLLSQARQRAWDLQSRLVWAPGLANGAALIAVAGVIGNVTHPDAALDALWPALSMFAAGLVTSALSAVCLVLHARELAKRADLADKVAQANVAGGSIQNDLIAKIQALTINAKANPDSFAPGLAEILAQGEAHKAGLPLLKDLQRRIEGLPAKEPKTELVAYGLSGLALALCVLGFVSIIVGHVVGGVRLEPHVDLARLPAKAPMQAAAPIQKHR